MSVGVIKDGKAVETAGCASTPRPVTGVGTLGPGASQGTCKWIRSGNVVLVNIEGLVVTDRTAPAVYFTGLPKPVVPFIKYIAGARGDAGGNCINMFENGNIVANNMANVNSGALYDSFMYIAEPEA